MQYPGERLRIGYAKYPAPPEGEMVADPAAFGRPSVEVSNAVKKVFRFCVWGGLGPEIFDFGPLPGPTRPRGGLGKSPGRGPARCALIFSPVDKF